MLLRLTYSLQTLSSVIIPSDRRRRPLGIYIWLDCRLQGLFVSIEKNCQSECFPCESQTFNLIITNLIKHLQLIMTTEQIKLTFLKFCQLCKTKDLLHVVAQSSTLWCLICYACCYLKSTLFCAHRCARYSQEYSSFSTLTCPWFPASLLLPMLLSAA